MAFHETSPPEDEGTGIGLSTSREIIRSAAGAIDVDNAAEGALFTLRIPMRPAVRG
jgi:signal transduction histidine kinase